VLRSEADVRSMMAQLLTSALPNLGQQEIASRTDTVFDFLVAITVARAMTRGLAGRDGFCDKTAHALRTLALAGA